MVTDTMYQLLLNEMTYICVQLPSENDPRAPTEMSEQAIIG